MRDLVDVSEICFDGHPDKMDSAQQVIRHLANRVEEVYHSIHQLEMEISRLEQELQRVNEKLSAARGTLP
jgi:predicted  nucleic acid-binding Zn-ribbon protein